MEILFLGTGAGIPSKGRNVSSLALRLHDEINETWLFDCGEATQHQILRTAIRPKKITNIFITHLHGDHIFGLPGFLSSRSFQGGDNPLNLYGPPGIRDFVLQSLKLSKSNLRYTLKIKELSPQGGQIRTEAGWLVDYLPLNHGVLSFGFRILEPCKMGELLVDELSVFNIPQGPIYGQLKRGETVVLEDGTVIDGSQYIAPARLGRIVTILGDTRPCQNSQILAKDADLLVHEATHGSDEGEMAHQYYHSTNIQAVQIAKRANVKQLVLNHISARYLAEQVSQIELEAQAEFPETVVAHDLMTVQIPHN